MGQQVLAVAFLTSVDSLPCPTTIFSLHPSADCHSLGSYLKPTVLFCLPLSTALSRTFIPSSTSGLAGDLVLSPLRGFRAKIDRSSEWRQHKRKRIATHRVTHITFYSWRFVKFLTFIRLNEELTIRIEMEHFNRSSWAFLTNWQTYSYLLGSFWSPDWNHPIRAKCSFDLEFNNCQSYWLK